MNTTRWTPGPWVVPTGFYPKLYVGKDVSLIASHIICEVPCEKNQHGKEAPTATDFADALLIAAAPELYQALEQAITSMQDSGYPTSHVVLRAGKDALAKARGDHDDFPAIMKAFRDSLFRQADAELEVQP